MRIISVQNGEHSFCSNRRHDEEKSFNGHSFLPAKRGASSAEPTFFWSLGIRGRNQWKEPCFQDWSTSSSFDVRKMLGCCGQIARRWHCLGAQVFVFLAKDKGDSLRVTPLADEKKVRSFTLGGLTPEVVQKRQWTTLSQLVWQDTDLTRRSAALWTGFERSARVAGKISLMQQISHNRPAADKCKLASLTAEVAPVKSPKDHVATRGPGTPKVHHGTQNAVFYISYNWRPTTGFDPTTRSPGPRGCFLCNHLPACGRTFQQTMWVTCLPRVSWFPSPSLVVVPFHRSECPNPHPRTGPRTTQSLSLSIRSSPLCRPWNFKTVWISILN